MKSKCYQLKVIFQPPPLNPSPKFFLEEIFCDKAKGNKSFKNSPIKEPIKSFEKFSDKMQKVIEYTNMCDGQTGKQEENNMSPSAGKKHKKSNKSIASKSRSSVKQV